MLPHALATATELDGPRSLGRPESGTSPEHEMKRQMECQISIHERKNVIRLPRGSGLLCRLLIEL